MPSTVTEGILWSLNFAIRVTGSFTLHLTEVLEQGIPDSGLWAGSGVCCFPPADELRLPFPFQVLLPQQVDIAGRHNDQEQSERLSCSSLVEQ